MTVRTRYNWEGPILQKVRQSDAALLEVTHHQPDRELILELNKRKRIEKPQKDLTFGRQVLSIPELDWELIRALYPELEAPDNEIRTKAWRKFMASPDSEPYRV